MIILDTNVISELMRPEPEIKVLNWLRGKDAGQVFLTSVTAAELWYGVNLLPDGSRRRDIEIRLRATLDEDFSGRVLDFDRAAAAEFGRLHAAQKRNGRLPDFADSQIAAIASIRSFVVATRNVRDFAHAGLDVVNPWTD